MADYEQWSRRLQETFAGSAERATLAFLGEAEEQYARHGVSLLKAHVLLIDSFQIFWIETIHAAIAAWQVAPAKGATQYYGATLREHLMVFKRLRACELLAEHGYPLPARADQRSDRAGFAHGGDREQGHRLQRGSWSGNGARRTGRNPRKPSCGNECADKGPVGRNRGGH